MITERTIEQHAADIGAAMAQQEIDMWRDQHGGTMHNAGPWKFGTLGVIEIPDDIAGSTDHNDFTARVEKFAAASWEAARFDND